LSRAPQQASEAGRAAEAAATGQQGDVCWEVWGAPSDSATVCGTGSREDEHCSTADRREMAEIERDTDETADRRRARAETQARVEKTCWSVRGPVIPPK